MTRKLYLSDPTLRVHTATIVSITEGPTTIVRLDETIFHAQGGGQKADRGKIGSAPIVHVAHNADDIDHHVESAEGLRVGQSILLEVDDEWRHLNAAYHTAGHLIAGVIESMYPGMRALSGHQWPGEGRVEFTGNIPLDQMSLERINERLMTDISGRLKVSIEGDLIQNRAIRIGIYEAIPCGGTHVQHLGEIEFVAVKNLRAKNERIRASFDASPLKS